MWWRGFDDLGTEEGKSSLNTGFLPAIPGSGVEPGPSAGNQSRERKRLPMATGRVTRTAPKSPECSEEGVERGRCKWAFTILDSMANGQAPIL